jgi:hypothetical protein
MTTKHISIAVVFAVVMTIATVLWSGDRSMSNIGILAVIGLVVGLFWVWVMKRRGYLR